MADPSVLSGEPVDDVTRVYAPPAPEFRLERVRVPPASDAALAAPPCAAIIVVVEGEGKRELQWECCAAHTARANCCDSCRRSW